MSHFPSMLANPAPASLPPLEVTSPYSGELLATVDVSDEAAIEKALVTAHQLFRNRKAWLSVSERGDILAKVAQIMQTRFDELVEGAAAEGGKPLADSKVEVSRAIEGIRMCAEVICNEAGYVVPLTERQANTSRMAFTQKEPIGVVVAVSAFNHPLNLIVHQVGAAFAAGCPCIVKPADDTPLSCYRFVQILRESGLPEAWCQVVMPAELALATKLVADTRVAFFSFIGSARVGWMLRSKLAAGTRCALEHGGVAPVIVDRSAHIDKLIPTVLKGGYYHAGQVCVSVQRVFVHQEQLNEVADKLAEGAQKLIVGDALDIKTEVGPLIRQGEVERVHAWVEEAVKEGATLKTGGKLLPNNCYAPTLLVNPKPTSKVSNMEIFGPVVCVYAYSDVNQAIEQANSLEFAFQAAIYAQDMDHAIDIFHKLDASAVMINDHTAFRQDGMPFAGLRQSGLGVGGISHTIEDMQIEKMMVIKSVLS